MAALSSTTDPSILKVATWNIAAVNNNPMEYWTTYDAPEYTQLMQDIESMIDAPGDRDVFMSEVFPQAAVDDLCGLMRGAGWEGVDEVAALWASDLSKRPIVTGFLKDKGLGSKRFMSMPDRFTNTINTLEADGVTPGPVACRPSVINNYVGDMSSFEAWWAAWRVFMFEVPLTVGSKKGPKTAPPVALLGPIPRAK